MGKKGVVYCIENKINGKKYIGQTTNLKNRWSEHKRKLRKEKHHNNHLQNSYNKYGKEGFKFYILEEVKKEKIDEREIYWIDFYNTFKSEGYNLKSGGKSNCDFSEETIQKIREASKGRKHTEETKENIRMAKLGEKNPMYGKTGEKNHFYGKTHSEETKEKLRELAKGRSLPQSAKEKLSKMNTGEGNPFYGREHSEKTKQKLRKKMTGKKHSRKSKRKMSKITEKEALEIYEKYKNGDVYQKELAKKYNISKTVVCRIVNCNHWSTEHLL